MSPGVAPFFDLIGITSVAWLDDIFEAKLEISDPEIVAAIAAARAGGATVTHPKMEDITAEDSAQEWARRIRERLNGEEIAQFVEQLKSKPSQPDTPADYTPDESKEVASALGSAVQCIGLGRWNEVKEELIKSARNGIFLVDLQRREGDEHVNAGGEIVKELVERCPLDTMVVILTHSVGPDGTEVLRRELAGELNISPTRIGVVSKRATDSTVTAGVRAAVRVALTQLTCSVLTGRIVATMRKALEETQIALEQLPVNALDRAIFENSLAEGSSEIDVLCRILLSRERTAVEGDIANALDEVHSPLVRMRKLRALESFPKVPPEDATLIREWRRDEIFDVGSRLNAMRAPLACGDVFQKDKTEKYFVLLGQPCDLMVRSNGFRNASEGILVRIDTSYLQRPAAQGRYFEVPALSGTDAWALDFGEWFSVNLECLDWASFNDEGKVRFSKADELPLGLLPGWERRFEKAKARLSSGVKEYYLGLNKTQTLVSASVDFPFKRVARLRSPRAEAAYAAFSSFQARGAFDHDFAKGIGEESEEGAPPLSENS